MALETHAPDPATKPPIERAVMPAAHTKVTVTMKIEADFMDMLLFTAETVDGNKVLVSNSSSYTRLVETGDLRQIVSELSAFLDSVDRVYHGEDKSPSKAQWPAFGGIVDTDE